MNLHTKLVRLFSCYPGMYSTSMFVMSFYAIPIYILVLAVMYNSRRIKPLNSLFFQSLVLPLGIVDILHVVHIYLFVKLPAMGYFGDLLAKHQFLALFGHFMNNVLGLSQYFAVTLTSLNRFMALQFVMSPINNQVWTRQNVKRAWSVHLSLAVVLNLIFIYYTKPVYTLRNNSAAILTYFVLEKAMSLLRIGAIIALLFLVVNFLLLMATARLILNRSLRNRKLRKASAVSNTQMAVNNFVVASKSEITLSVFAMLLSSCMFLFVFFVYLNVNEKKWLQVGRFRFVAAFEKLILHLSLDVMGVINPFGLLTLSSALRKAVFAFFLPKKGCSENQELIGKASRILLILPTIYYLVLICMILGLYDINDSCAPGDLMYSGSQANATVHGFPVEATNYTLCMNAMNC